MVVELAPAPEATGELKDINGPSSKGDLLSQKDAAAMTSVESQASDLLEMEAKIRSRILDSNSLSLDEKAGVLEQISKIIENDLVVGNPNLSPKEFKARLLEEVVNAILDPTSMKQGWRSTCTVVSMRYELAKNSPEEFARIISELATQPQQEGVELRGTAVMRLYSNIVSLNGDRGLIGEIFDPAAMKLAAKGRTERLGRTYEYNDTDDMTSEKNGRGHIKGLFGIDYDYVAGQLRGKGFDRISIYNSNETYKTRDEIRGKIIGDIIEQRGACVEIMTNVSQHEHHMVYVEEIDKEKGTVTFFNPWGEIDHLSLSDFKKVLVGALLENEEDAWNRSFITDEAVAVRDREGEIIYKWAVPPEDPLERSLSEIIKESLSKEEKAEESSPIDLRPKEEQQAEPKKIVPGNPAQNRTTAKRQDEAWWDDERWHKLNSEN